MRARAAPRHGYADQHAQCLKGLYHVRQHVDARIRNNVHEKGAAQPAVRVRTHVHDLVSVHVFATKSGVFQHLLLALRKLEREPQIIDYIKHVRDKTSQSEAHAHDDKHT